MVSREANFYYLRLLSGTLYRVRVPAFRAGVAVEVLESSAWSPALALGASPRKRPPQTNANLPASFQITAVSHRCFQDNGFFKFALGPECRATHRDLLDPLSERCPWGGMPRASSRFAQDLECLSLLSL